MHRMAFKRVLCYLKGTVGYGIQYKIGESGKCVIGFSVAEWAGDINGRKSTSGNLFQMSEGAISWRNKKQDFVGLSMVPSMWALSSAAQESVDSGRLQLK